MIVKIDDRMGVEKDEKSIDMDIIIKSSAKRNTKKRRIPGSNIPENMKINILKTEIIIINATNIVNANPRNFPRIKSLRSTGLLKMKYT